MAAAAHEPNERSSSLAIEFLASQDHIPRAPSDKYLSFAHHAFAHEDVPFVAILAGCVMQLIAGMPYAFGAYADGLKHSLGLTESEVASCGAALDIGLYLMLPVAGLCIDALGAPTIAITATTATLLGNGGIFLLLRRVESCKAKPFLWLLLTCFFLAGTASCCINILAVTTNAKRSPLPHRARVIAAHSTCFALSALLVGVTLEPLSRGGQLSHFFGTWAVVGGAVVGAGGLVLCSRAGGDPRPALVEDFHADLRAADGLEPAASQISVAKAIEDEVSSLHQLRAMCVHIDLWLLLALLFSGFGAGLVVVNNLQLFVRSAGGSAAQGAPLSVAFPLGNAIGRALFGLLADVRSGPLAHVRRGHWMVLALATMSVANVLAAILFARASGEGAAQLGPIWGLVVPVAASYGVLWVSSQAAVAESYPLEHFGSMLGLLSFTAGLAGLAFNLACARLYEAAAHLHADTDCLGAACFRPTFVMMAGATAFGTGCALAFVRFTQSPDELGREEEAAAAAAAAPASATAAVRSSALDDFPGHRRVELDIGPRHDSAPACK